MKMALIRNIHFSNSTGSFPIYLDVFPCHRQDIYRTFTILYLKYTEYHGGCLISNMNCLLTRSHHHFCSFWWCSCCLSLQYVLFVLVVSCVQSVCLGCALCPVCFSWLCLVPSLFFLISSSVFTNVYLLSQSALNQQVDVQCLSM